MKILRGGGRLADLNIISRCKLQEALDTRTRMFRPLPFVTVGQQHHKSRKQIPFVFTWGYELSDDCFRAVGEITELPFPQHQRFRKVPAEAVFEPENRSLGKRRIVSLEPTLPWRHMFEGHEILLLPDIDPRR